MTDSVLDVLDELAALLEPDPMLRDDSGDRPGIDSLAEDRLYLWALREPFTLVSMGYEDRAGFVVQAAWAAERMLADEPARREVTERIVARARALRDALAAVAGRGTTFDQAHVDEVDYEGLRALDVRGFTATISGYRIIGGQA